jgi:hypothetical protein
MTESSQDYVGTVKEAAAAAEQGDDGAARELSVISSRCILVIRSVRKGESKQSYLAALPFSSSTPYVAHMEHIYDQCAPLAVAPELADWNANSPTGKFNAGYWRKVALELQNPATRVENIAAEAGHPPTAAADRKALLDRTRQVATEILRSQDGEAWYKLGMRLGNSDLAKDVTLGLALTIASCDMGYDCSGANERNQLNQCQWFDGCTGSEDVRQRLQSGNPQQYAKAYAKYQELKDLLRDGRWDDIAKYAPIDGSLSQ